MERRGRNEGRNEVQWKGGSAVKADRHEGSEGRKRRKGAKLGRKKRKETKAERK